MAQDIRQKITPQMREYTRIAKRQLWLPYLMYFQQPNFVSEVVNTDSRGFRVVYKNSNKISDFKHDRDKPTSIFVGNSAAFGVGASSDEHTIPSLLNSKDDSVWLNFGGRAFSSTQEFLLFLFYHRHFSNIDKVIVFSGVNNLILYYLSQEYSKDLGSFFFFSSFRQALKETPPLKRRIAQKILNPFYGDQIDWDNFSKKDLIKLLTERGRKSTQIKKAPSDFYSIINNHDEEKMDLLYALETDIYNWKLLSQSLNFDLYYILQPIATWTRKKLSSEEHDLFAVLDGKQQEQFQILKKNFSQDQYLWFSNQLQTICETYDVSFMDMNEKMREKPIDDEWLFVDRIHLTDSGHQLVSEIIYEEVLK
ncbi:MAG: hypothetical protein ISS57_16665 [Anaerolineales bacterium]|nr:hypothetical protein [Anaerolineales bacterium]